MTRIRVRCPICGDVALAFDVTLQIGPDSTYSFTCPECDERITKPADGRIVELLLAVGVIPASSSVPAEAFEEHTGPPITADDVLTFHELLEQPDWFNRLCLLGPFQF
jgi:uncharacterized protein YlaI